MISFEYFICYIFPVLILVTGLIGNLLGYIIIKRPKMLEIGPRNTYKYFFIMDTIFLVQIIVTHLQLTYNIDITIQLNLICKLWNYLNYSLDTQSSMLIVYISLDRYVSLKIPAKRFLLRKRNNQFIYFMFIFMFNLLFYLPVAYDYELKQDLNNNTILICDFTSHFAQDLISYMDLANRVVLPSILILIFSILLGIEVIKSKKRILSNFQHEENVYYFNNISLAITSVFLNLIYILLLTPIAIYDSTMFGHIVAYYLLYFSYSFNFYVIFMFNSLFRNEFIFFLKRLKNNYF
jgi:hypothetical protein